MTASFPDFCLGGNVFGWTADEAASFDVLDAAHAAGITFIDTADAYASWAHGGVGGQSETIIGGWLAARSLRGQVTIATKGGAAPGLDNIRPATIRKAAEASLQRLGVDHIDLYYAHYDDGGDLNESLAAFDALVQEGAIGAIGLSNFSAERIVEAFEICAREGFTAPAALQPQYSLMERDFERELRDVAERTELAVMPYYALAGGFLTGKYRPGGPDVESQRASGAREYLAQPRGIAILEALDNAAQTHGVAPASIALAWLRAQPTVVAPIASARTVEQIKPLADCIGLKLTPEELQTLRDASAI
jgi:aryl-alcohol dehydrogenase-like predicted oxidoreductase